MVGILAASWDRFQRVDGVTDVFAIALDPYPDDIVLAAAQNVVNSQTRCPAVAHIVEEAKRLTAQHYAAIRTREEQGRQSESRTYWERSPEERAEIDIAKAECMSAVRKMCSEFNRREAGLTGARMPARPMEAPIPMAMPKQAPEPTVVIQGAKREEKPTLQEQDDFDFRSWMDK